MTAPVPDNEAERLEALKLYQILDTKPETNYDDLAFLASTICETPISVMSLIDKDRQWFKAKTGLDITETSREVAFCAHTILQTTPMIIPDAELDARFANNPLVTGEAHIRFYAGVPLVAGSGLALGSLCVIDRKPRLLSKTQISALEALGRQIISLLELRRATAVLAEQLAKVKTLHGLLPICGFCKGIRNDEGYWMKVEDYLRAHSDASFSHGICKKCSQKHYPELFEQSENKAA
jgi:GAF domain-containing protein